MTFDIDITNVFVGYVNVKTIRYFVKSATKSENNGKYGEESDDRCRKARIGGKIR